MYKDSAKTLIPFAHLFWQHLSKKSRGWEHGAGALDGVRDGPQTAMVFNALF